LGLFFILREQTEVHLLLEAPPDHLRPQRITKTLIY
jgi:hypothetical protein